MYLWTWHKLILVTRKFEEVGLVVVKTLHTREASAVEGDITHQEEALVAPVDKGGQTRESRPGR